MFFFDCIIILFILLLSSIYCLDKIQFIYLLFYCEILGLFLVQVILYKKVYDYLYVDFSVSLSFNFFRVNIWKEDLLILWKFYYKFF